MATRGLHLDKDEMLSVYNLINARMCGGALPPAIIVLSNKKTKNVTQTVTRSGLTTSTLTHTQQRNADIELELVSGGAGRKVLNPDKPVVITYYPHMATEPEETLWCTTWHEMCHALAADEDADHGPRWTRHATSGGMTVNTGMNDAGEACQVGEGHQIIPGGPLDMVRQEWLSALVADASVPHQRAAPARSHAEAGAGRFVAARQPAQQAPVVRQSSVSAATARTPIGGRFSPAAPAHASRVTPGAIPKSAKTVFIYADCSGSMIGDGISNMVTALGGIWPVEGAELFAYSDDVRPANSPHDLVEVSQDMGAGTSFEAIMLHAEHYNPDMVLIFSDGQPCDEVRTWAVWDRTDFPIGTHYCVNSDFAHGASVQYMIELCRGGGEATIGDDPIDIQEGVKRAMTNHPRQPRQLPDLRPRINTGIARLRGKLGIGKRIVELGDENQENAYNAAVGQAINAIDGTFDHLAGELDGLFGQAFDGQREQAKVNAQHWGEAAENLNNGLAQLSTKLLGAAKGEIEGTLVAGQQRIAATKARPDAVRVAAPSINPNLLARSAAVRAANTNGALALPAPVQGVTRALPAPSTAAGETPINEVSGQAAQRERAPAVAGRATP